MKKILLLIILLTSINFFGQTTQDSLQAPEHNIFVGLSSQGSVLSAGYEHLFQQAPNTNITYVLGFQVGYNWEREIFEYYQSLRTSSNARERKKFNTFSGHFTLNLGYHQSKFEIGIGTGFVGTEFAVYPIMGYRLIPAKKGNVSLRITTNYPFFLSDETPPINFFPIGINIGISF